MAISRCNSCGTLTEHEREMVGTQMSCVRCETSSPIYDTVYFLSKLFDHYFFQRNELKTLRAAAPAATPQHTEVADTPFNIHNSDLLSSEAQHKPIIDWLRSKSISATINMDAVDTTGFFDEAAVAIGNDFDLLGEICERIRFAQLKEYTSTLLHLDKKTAGDAKELESFARKLHDYSLLGRCIVNREEKSIRLVLQNAPSVRRFFSGEWLEWYALMVCLRICQERKVEFSCARNLVIELQPGERREMDVFFLLNKTRPLYIECKTGEFRQDLDKYISLRKRLNIESKYFILCIADIDMEQAKGLSAMHGMTFVNVQNLGQHFLTLI